LLRKQNDFRASSKNNFIMIKKFLNSRNSIVLDSNQLKNVKGGARFSCACTNGSGFSIDVNTTQELVEAIAYVCAGSGGTCTAIDG
jgi:hypothetical protein